MWRRDGRERSYCQIRQDRVDSAPTLPGGCMVGDAIADAATPNVAAVFAAGVMMGGTLIVSSCATTQSGSTSTDSSPRVTIDAGMLTGRMDSASGVQVFEGISYAAPPVGDLRWRP